MVCRYSSLNKRRHTLCLHLPPNHFSCHFRGYPNRGQELWNQKSVKSFKRLKAQMLGSYLDLVCKTYPHSYPSLYSLSGGMCSGSSVLLSNVSQFSFACAEFRRDWTSHFCPTVIASLHPLNMKPGGKHAT